MQEIADLYLQLGAVGFCLILLGFMILNLIKSQKEQTNDLESIKQSISKMESEISNAQSISIKLVDRINSSDSKREDFWREISDDISFIKGRLNGRGN